MYSAPGTWPLLQLGGNQFYICRVHSLEINHLEIITQLRQEKFTVQMSRD